MPASYEAFIIYPSSLILFHSLSSKIRGILAPQVGVPFQNFIFGKFVLSQPILRAVDEGEEQGIFCCVLEVCFTDAIHYPGDGIF